MNRLIRNLALIICVWLSLAGVCFGKQVYLRDGGVIECKSFWQRGDTVIVKVNRDTLLEFQRHEINLQRTFHKTAKKSHIVRPKNATIASAPAVQPAAVKAAVTPAQAVAAKPLPAAPQSVKPAASVPPATATKPLQPTSPAAKPAPTPSPAPAAKQVPPPPAPAPLPEKIETLPPAASQPVPAEPSAADLRADSDSKRKQAAEMMTEAIRNNNPELMKKAVALQQSTMKPEDRARSAGIGLKFILILAICSLLIIISNWVIFEKAGYSGWKCLVPIYNLYILMEVCGKPWWWLFLLFIPLVGAAFYLMAMLSLAERFGRGALIGIGLFILPMFFMPIIAFGGSEYEA